ncbi:heat shock protein GrpE (activation of DnaK) [Mycoplasmopsis maculosa]|uniref:Protein GrpE n=1 Tax=Mycoplasmopsis maculosa TaxID=114885 RepID=A0A449B408_9BACT|nr:nucleotide exchange factor GrpE [Mycoplasmopsis maculosa]VEU75327.1 heat shock protein GrpE (activation of DnaK) [Mycoplasmopsis maculosa]
MKLDLEKNILSKGDKIIIDVNVYNKDILVKKLSTKNYSLILGGKFYLPFLSKMLVGKTLNKKIIFNYLVEEDNKSLKEFVNEELKVEVKINDYVESKYVKSKNSNIQLKEHISSLEKIIKEKDFELSKKLVSIPEDKKKEIERYSLQKFFEEFSKYYSVFKFTTEKLVLKAQEEEDSNRLKLLSNYKATIWQFDELFKNFGLEEIRPIFGEQFDPNTQKVMDQFIDDELESNTIINVLSIGYKLYDRVIKVANVVTSLKSTDVQAKKILEEKGPENSYLKK